MVIEAVGAPFRWAAAARRARAFHPTGVVCAGAAHFSEPAMGSVELSSPSLTVRLSKGVGTPDGFPDVAGVALRISVGDGAPWDLLLATGSRQAVRLAIPVPAMSWSTAVFSSLVPFRSAGHLWWLRAEFADTPHLTDLSTRRVRIAVDSDRAVHLRLSHARGPLGSFEPFGEVVLHSSDSESHIDFDPIGNLPSGVTMVPGWLAGLRRSSYANSRLGRHGRHRP